MGGEGELEKKSPPDSRWQRRHKFFHHLSADVGNPHVEKQVAVITALFKGASNRSAFWTSYWRNFPDKSGQLELDVDFEKAEISADPNEPGPPS
jgi:hypothetical protein